MQLIKAIRKQLATDTKLTIIRADQPGGVPALPYATYKVIGDRDGTGRENIAHMDESSVLIENREQERRTTLSFVVYGTNHDNAHETACNLRKWFEWRGEETLDLLNVSIVSLGDVKNRSVFLVNSYDEKYGFDVTIRYIEQDQYEVDYFDKVESEIIIDRE